MHVDIRADSVCYRRKITGMERGSSPDSSSVQVASAVPSEPSRQDADADGWVGISPGAVLEQWNAALKRPSFAVGFVLGGVVVGSALSFLHPLWFLPSFGIGLFLASLANRRDKKRRAFPLEYQFDEAGQKRWEARTAALAALNKAQVLWCVTSLDRTYDWKQQTGSTSLASRFRATLAQQPAVSLQAAHQFGALFPQSRTVTTHPASQPKARGQKSPPRSPQPEFTSPPAEPLPACYETLELPLTCTQAEATAKYRQLAMSYHPDRYQDRPDVFKALAHEKMSEINTSFSELKRLRGW